MKIKLKEAMLTYFIEQCHVISSSTREFEDLQRFFGHLFIHHTDAFSVVVIIKMA